MVTMSNEYQRNYYQKNKEKYARSAFNTFGLCSTVLKNALTCATGAPLVCASCFNCKTKSAKSPPQDCAYTGLLKSRGRLSIAALARRVTVQFIKRITAPFSLPV